MKKLLLLLILISACKKEVRYYPSEEFFKENNPQEIIIDNLSFKEVADSIRDGLYTDKELFIKIKESNKIYNIAPFADTGGYRRERNALYIRNDSLDLIKGRYPFKDLSKYLKLYYENNNKEYFYPSSYKWVHLVIAFEPSEGSKKLEKLLSRIIKIYNHTNIRDKDSIDFNIMLEYPLDKVFPSPQPPSPIQIFD